MVFLESQTLCSEFRAEFELYKLLFHFISRLLMRVCLTLTSRASDVRTAARDTLAKIMISLGIKYFPFMLKELRSSLKRGYQVITILTLFFLNNFQKTTFHATRTTLQQEKQ